MEESQRDFKWLFPEEKLRNTPSQRMGVSPEKEITFRQKEAMLIQAIGSKAHLTQLAVNTSVVFMHRFFMFRSILYYPRVQLAIAFALAGGKVEESESARKLEHLIRSAVEVLCANKYREFLDKSDQFTYEMDSRLRPKIAALKESRCSTDTVEYLEMRKLILECETEIYSVIGFQLQITHPHNFVLRMCTNLGSDGIKDITQYAYNLATASSQLTMLCLKYKPETIATMCLNVALKANAMKLVPKETSNLMKWYQVHDDETNYSEVETVSEEFLKLVKSCSLLPTWMGMLGKFGKRNLSGPVRGPGGYPISRQPLSAMSAAAAKAMNSSTNNPGGQRYSNSSSQPSAEFAQHRSSQGSSSSQSSRPPYPPSARSQASRNSSSLSSSSSSQSQGTSSSSQSQGTSSSSQSQGDSQSSSSSWSHSQQPSSVSSNVLSSSSMRPSQDNTRRASKLGPPGDASRQREDQSRPHPSSKMDQHINSEQDRQRPPLASHRQQESHNLTQQSLAPPRVADPPSSQATLEDDDSPANDDSPVAVRPPSPPFPPPNDIDQDEIDDPGAEKLPTQSSNSAAAGAGRITSPDFADNNSSGFPSAPAAGPKLSLSDYRQRATAKLKDKPSISVPQVQESLQEDVFALKLEEIPAREEMKTEPAVISPKEEKPFQAVAGYSFSKPQDSPNNRRITLKVKRDPSSVERHSVKYADSGLKIKIKQPKPEIETEVAAAGIEYKAELGTPTEEGEILEDSPSPASSSSTGSSRRSEGIKLRLPVPKSLDSSGKREADLWSSRRSAEHESNHRSRHHGHHYHRNHHKSKKHKEHRSSRHEGKSSSGHHSSKRPAGYSYDDRPGKLQRLSDGNPAHTGREETAVPPLPPLAPPQHSHYSLQHQNSGFSINDAFSSSLLPSLDSLPDHGEDGNLSAPSTPLEAIPPHHERFHRIMEEHRAREEAKRPPLPPVPPPPPPPSSPPPPPPPSLM